MVKNLVRLFKIEAWHFEHFFSQIIAHIWIDVCIKCTSESFLFEDFLGWVPSFLGDGCFVVGSIFRDICLRGDLFGDVFGEGTFFGDWCLLAGTIIGERGFVVGTFFGDAHYVVGTFQRQMFCRGDLFGDEHLYDIEQKYLDFNIS